jgi:hypothetical protein
MTGTPCPPDLGSTGGLKRTAAKPSAIFFLDGVDETPNPVHAFCFYGTALEDAAGGLVAPGVCRALRPLLLEGLRVAATAVRPVGGGVAREPSHLDLSVAHHYHELTEAGAYFIGLTRLEPSEVKTFSLSVVRQRRYANSQEKPGVQTQCRGALLLRRFCTLLGRFPQP